MYLCQMSGIPGTGKSTLSRYICQMTGSILLDLDIIKSSVMASFENNIEFKFAGKVSYDLAFALADNYLGLKRNVVIDSPCAYDIILERGITLAKKHSASYKFIECRLNDLTELNRRRTERDILPSQVYNIIIDEKEYLESLEKLKRPTSKEYLLVDTGQDIEKYMGSVIDYLNDKSD